MRLQFLHNLRNITQLVRCHIGIIQNPVIPLPLGMIQSHQFHRFINQFQKLIGAADRFHPWLNIRLIIIQIHSCLINRFQKAVHIRPIFLPETVLHLPDLHLHTPGNRTINLKQYNHIMIRLVFFAFLRNNSALTHNNPPNQIKKSNKLLC